MTVRVYKSTDSGAPVLYGNTTNLPTGGIQGLFDACLVNGYGSKVAAGWTKLTTGTTTANAAYKSPTSNMCIRVQDGANVDRCTAVSVYSSMSDAATGNDAFGGASGGGGGSNDVVRSQTADTVARDWVLVTSGGTIYLWINTDNGTNGATGAIFYAFGEFTSYKSGDLYNYLCTGRSTNGTPAYSITINTGQQIAYPGVDATTTTSGLALCRSYTQVSGAVQAFRLIDGSKLQSPGTTTSFYIGGKSGLSYPNLVDGSIYLSPIWICEGASALRGEYKGLWAPCHSLPLGHMDTFDGSGALAGKTFLALRAYGPSEFLLEISDTW